MFLTICSVYCQAQDDLFLSDFSGKFCILYINHKTINLTIKKVCHPVMQVNKDSTETVRNMTVLHADVDHC